MTTFTPIPSIALRDAALTVATLADMAQPPSFAGFRETCAALVARLKEEFTADGQPADVVRDAAYALCALLDEIALGHLGKSRGAWESEPLQVREFQSHDAGNELIDNIRRRLAEPKPVLPLLAVYAAVLGLGFQGRFALEGAVARSALMRALDERLEQAGLRNASSGPVTVTGGKARRWQGLSPLAWTTLALVAAGGIYLALDRWLTASIARIVG